MITNNVDSIPGYFFALAINKEVSFIGNPPTGQIPPEPAACCKPCYVLPALVDPTNTDPYYNDTSPIVYCALTEGDTINFFLEKFDNGAWTEVAQISDDTLGIFKAKGTLTNTLLQYFIVSWRQVYITYGADFYRFRIDVEGIAEYTTYSFAWCVHKFGKYTADGTVKFDWVLRDNQHDINDWQTKTDYADADIPCSIRVTGMFGKPKVDYENKEVDFEIGDVEKYRVETTPTYEFESGRYYYLIHNILAYSVFPSNNLKVTDYCLKNPDQSIRNLQILCTSGYSPKYKNDSTLLNRVAASFKYKKWDTGRKLSEF